MAIIDKLKVLAAILLVIAGLAVYYKLPEAASWRPLVVVAGLILGAIVFWRSMPGAKFVSYARESWGEGKKVVWPTRKETLQVTGVVFLFVVVLGIFLGATDWVLYKLVYGVLLKRG